MSLKSLVNLLVQLRRKSSSLETGSVILLKRNAFVSIADLRYNIKGAGKVLRKTSKNVIRSFKNSIPLRNTTDLATNMTNDLIGKDI